MSYSYSAGVITQTGADTSLAGLVGLTGVTSIVNGGITVYTLTSVSLLITGQLSIPLTQRLIVSFPDGTIAGAALNEIKISGTTASLTLGSNTNPERSSRPTVLQITRLSNTDFQDDDATLLTRSGLRVQNGGTLYTYGVTIEMSSNFYLCDTVGTPGKWTGRHTSIVMLRRTASLSTFGYHDIDNISLFGARGMRPSTSSTGSIIGKVNTYTGNGFYQPYNLATLDVKNWTGVADNGGTWDVEDIKLTSTKRWYFTDSNKGSTLAIRLAVDATDTIVYARQTLRISVLDDIGAAYTEDVHVYMVDSESTVYSGTLVAGSGTISNVVVARWQTANSSTPVILSTGAGDSMTLRAIAYNGKPTFTRPALRGTGGTDAGLTILADAYITETAKSVVDSYTTVDNVYQLYDVAKSHLIDYFTGETQTYFEGSNLGSYNLIVDATASLLFDINVDTITIKSNVFDAVGLVTTGLVSVMNGASVTGSYKDSLGVHTYITAPAMITGTRLQLYNLTDGVELYNGVLASDGLSFPVNWTANKTVRFRADHETKLPIETVGILSSIGLDFLDVQEEDHVYVANGIDGSTCTEFTDDDPNIQIDINDPDGVTSIHRMYAWMQWYQTTADGIASPFFGCLYALDTANYIVYSAKANLQLDNVGVLPVRIEGGYIYRDDGGTIIASTSNSIQLEPKRPSVPDVSTLAQQVWEYSLRALTVDPGSAAHAVTQAAIAALPVPASTVDVTGARDAVISALPPSPPTTNDIWNATTRSLTVDPGASAHVATQSLITTKAGDIQTDIAGLPVPLTSIETQTLVTSALTSANLATQTDIVTAQTSIESKQDTTQAALENAIANIPSNVRTESYSGPQTPGSLGQFVQETASRVIANL